MSTTTTTPQFGIIEALSILIGVKLILHIIVGTMLAITARSTK